MLRKNRPFSVLQHQAQFGLNPALMAFIHFTARRYASAVYAVVVCLSVRLSV